MLCNYTITHSTTYSAFYFGQIQLATRMRVDALAWFGGDQRGQNHCRRFSCRGGGRVRPGVGLHGIFVGIRISPVVGLPETVKVCEFNSGRQRCTAQPFYDWCGCACCAHQLEV